MVIDWRDRVKALLGKKSMSQAELARTMGVSTASVSVWLGGKVALTDKNTLKLQYQVAAALGVEPDHIIEGKGDATKASAKGRAVPQLTKEAATHWILTGVTSDSTEWINCPLGCSNRAFCLTINGTSMDNCGMPGVSFPDKSLVFIEPDLPMELGKICLFQDKGLVLGIFEEINDQSVIVFNNPRFAAVAVLRDNYIGRSIGCFTQT